MSKKIKVYFSNFESVISDLIWSADHSIDIAMAWFTNGYIIESIKSKVARDNICARVLIDKNKSNEEYFAPHIESLNSIGVKVRMKDEGRLMHNKFMVVDNKCLASGSYNYSIGGNSHFENLIIIDNREIGQYYERVFKFLYLDSYIDPNIKLLLEYPKIAKKMMSTHYWFTPNEYKKYKSKIEIGSCHVFDKGFGEIMYYSPGIIFNPSIFHLKRKGFKVIDKRYEEMLCFSPPIRKVEILNQIKINQLDLLYESYREIYDGNREGIFRFSDIISEMESIDTSLEEFFHRKFNKMLSIDELRNRLNNDINIVLEDDLCFINFLSFIDEKTAEKIFKEI